MFTHLSTDSAIRYDYADPVVSLVLAVGIGASVLPLLRRALPILLDAVPVSALSQTFGKQAMETGCSVVLAVIGGYKNFPSIGGEVERGNASERGEEIQQ